MKLFYTHIADLALYSTSKAPSSDYPTNHACFKQPTKIQLTYGCGTSQADVI